MIIYKCRFTGDEMLSDAFKPVDVKDDDGNVVVGLFQIESTKVNKVCPPTTNRTVPKVIVPGIASITNEWMRTVPLLLVVEVVCKRWTYSHVRFRLGFTT